MADTTIEEQISIGIQDGFSTALKSMQTQLTAILAPLGQVSVKLDEISKLNLSTTINQLSKIKDTVVDISNAAGKVQSKKDANESKSALNKAIKSNSDVMDKQTKVGLKDNENYKHLIDVRLKQLEARTATTKAYVEDVAKRASKEVKERNVEADTVSKIASAHYKNVKAEALLNSGQASFAGGWRGGVTSVFSHFGTSLRNRPFLGLLERMGSRMSQNPESWMGRRFGKLRGDGTDSWNLNNAFGGLLAKGTVKGLGINAGGIALGGFAAGLGSAVTAVEKFRDATLNAYGSMQKLAISMEVVYGSKSEANTAFGQLQQYATHSPFSVAETTEMAILLKQSGVYASDLQKTLEMIGDVSSGNEEKMKRIANNYAQIQAIGHANMLDMRQFAYAGLPIYEEVAKTMKTSQQALRSMISNGEVTAEIIEETFKRMTSEGGMFFKSVNKGSKAYSARQINLADIQNISKANWGEWLWNNGDSLAGRWLEMKEGLAEGVGKVGKGFAVGQNYWNAVDSDRYLNNLKQAYIEALAENNQPQAEMLKKSILDARGAGYGEDTIVSAFRERLMRMKGWDNKTLVDDSEIKNLKNQLSYIVKGNARTLEIGGAHYSPGDDAYERYIENATKNSKYLRLFDWDNKSGKANAESVAKVLNGVISRSDVFNALYELADSAKYSALAVKTLQSEISLFANTAADGTNKLARSAGSLSSRLTEYKQTYDSTPEAKAKKEAERFSQYQKDTLTLKKINKFFDADTDKFNGKYTSSDLNTLYNSGLLTATPLEWDFGTLFEPEEISKNTDLLISKLDSALSQFDTLGSNITATDKKTVDEITILRKNATEWIKNGNIKDINQSLGRITQAGIEAKGLSKFIINSIFQDFDAPKEIAKYVSTMQGDAYIPLWKRILGNATGYEAAKINTNAGTFLNNTYSEQVGRNITAGFVKGLTGAGFTSQSIANMFTYKSEDNKQNTRQIDWKATQKDIFEQLFYTADKSLQKLTDINLSTRPSVPESELYKKGWKDATGNGTATVFSSTYSNRDFGITDVPEKVINVTPILPNGDVLTPEELNEYVEDIFRNSGKGIHYKHSIVLGSFNSIPEAEESAVKLHDDQANILFKNSLSNKQYASVLQGTASALQSQISVFEQLKNVMQTTGEDWATINKYSLENSRYFDNAYAGSLEAIYKNGKGEEETYNMRFDKELGFVLDDMRLSANLNGKTINGLAKELKDGTTKFTKTEQELIKGLSENTEKIIPAIDGAVNQLQGINSRIDFSTKLVNMIANKVAGAQGEQATSFGSSEEVVNMFYNKMLGKVRMSEGEFPAIYNNMADGRNYNPESHRATATALGEVFKQLIATEVGTYEDYKKQYGNSALADNESDFNKLQQMAVDFRNANGDDAIQLQVANELFDTFLGDFERLAKALKTEEDLRIKTANATDANTVLLRTSVSTGGLTRYLDIFSGSSSLEGGNSNSFSEQSVLDYYGIGNKSWKKDFIPEYTKQGLNSSDANFRGSMANDIANRVYNALAERYRKANPGATDDEIEELYGKERSLVRTNADTSMINKDGKTAYENAQDYIKNVNDEYRLDLKLEDSATPFVKTQTALASLADTIGNIQDKTKDMIKGFGSGAIAGTFSELGKAWATGEDATEGIAKNLRALGSGLAANMGQMLTQAGLATIIGSMGKGEKFWTGIAMVAAGAGMSFLGGMMGAEEEDDDTDEEYKRLNQIKDDLSELLKQAREDAIYYENTVRHRKALSTNGSISVNDAIITPSGQVISTHPDDYLIATKTPQSLVGGGGTPVVNFSVIDKSTGIKVTKQKTTYDEDSNSMNLEVVIESKVQEIIASSKGDAAFNARQMRLSGNSYVG